MASQGIEPGSGRKRAILLAAFGASSMQGQASLKNFDSLVRERFPGIPVRWAYTSLILRERLARARQKSDSAAKALQRLAFEHFEEIAVQPLQTIAGKEYTELCRAAREVACKAGLVCRAGAPLLATDDDVRETARAIVRHLPQERLPNEDVVLMGHGARHAAVARYADLAVAVRGLDSHVHVGAMNGGQRLEEILTRIEGSRVWLMPLLSVVGRHAVQDMAGEQETSWRSRIEASGRTCVPVLKGMAECAGFAEIWLRHLGAVVRALGWTCKSVSTE
ncbi:MAG: sirohydrochlorin cobaltochelatase [Desulfovibrio sp.]|jgi:sirohydrochlorin cobaltochelatase|nr:sirohydrochlorin cobaltochelatase [Desulfovibrio sp.]